MLFLDILNNLIIKYANCKLLIVNYNNKSNHRLSIINNVSKLIENEKIIRIKNIFY